MAPGPLPWQYNEFQQVGKDYECPAEVEVYDASHAEFRDPRAEARRALALLRLPPGAVVIDFGTGTGSFAIEAALQGAAVHAVDVSERMLERAKAKAEAAGAAGIEFHQQGFLTYEHAPGTADAIATSFAFHQLPDFWKGVAVKRMAAMLRPGGRLYLYDVVLGEGDALATVAAFVARQEAAGGAFLRDDAVGHFGDEYSTYDWVMGGLLRRGGFEVVHKRTEAGVLAERLCSKR